MRRRRFPGRPFRRKPLVGMPPKRFPIPPKLREAHRLFETGEYEQAADLYSELADKAYKRDMPQAPNLYLRGGMAWLKTGDADKAIEMIQKGLGVLADRKKWMHLRKVSDFTIEQLKSEGHDEMARQIETWLEKQIPDEIMKTEIWLKDPSSDNTKTIKLPSNCGNCGGPVNPKEVEWYDAANPICAFCGTVLDLDG